MDKLLNLYYYFKEFEEKVNKDEDLKRIYEDLSKNINDSLVVKKSHVEISSDWINYIWNNLKWISDAIDENRQFIREDGEVLPVDRVKKINKSTIADLSKHSDYIERLDKDGNVIPSKLYTVNKETDYGIYENRFLYLLLQTLKSFVLDQMSSIEDALASGTTVLNVKRFDGFLDSENEIQITYKSKRHNQQEELSSGSLALKDKVEEITSKIDSLLSTPLMKQMSREAVISGEVTKTNVLRMDEAFKHCLEMYEYITNYTKAGHIINEELINKVAPDIRVAVIITELLTFVNEFSLESEYNEKYLNYTDVLRDEKIKALEEKLKDKSRDDYIINLEDLVLALKEKIIRFDDVKALYDAMSSKQGGIIHENEELVKNSKMLKSELEKANEDYIKKLNSYIENARNLNDENIKLKAELNQKNLLLNKSNETNNSLNDENSKLSEYNSQLLGKVSGLEAELEASKNSYEKDRNEYLEKINLLNSIISSNEIMNKTLNGDYTSKEAFDDLENQYEAFKKFFEAKWKETKKQIRKDMKKGE